MEPRDRMPVNRQEQTAPAQRKYPDPFAQRRTLLFDGPLIVPISGTKVVLGQFHRQIGISEKVLEEHVQARDDFHWHVLMAVAVTVAYYNGERKFMPANADGAVMVDTNIAKPVDLVWERYNSLIQRVLNPAADSEIPVEANSMGARIACFFDLGSAKEARKKREEVQHAQKGVRESWDDLEKISIEKVRAASEEARKIDPVSSYEALGGYSTYAGKIRRYGMLPECESKPTILPETESFIETKLQAMMRVVEMYADFLGLLSQ